jgi:8-oxo-dGTP diphosphatase
MKPHLTVVAAILTDGKKYFIAQRPHEKHLGGYWEFPGGKIDQGESPETALKREMAEELTVKVAVGEKIAETTNEYEDRIVTLLFYECTLISGTLTLLEHIDSAWVTAEEMVKYNLAPADLFLLKDKILT